MFEACNKSLALSSVCVFVYSRDTAHQRAQSDIDVYSNFILILIN